MVTRCAAGLMFVLVQIASADVYTYECDALPEEAGWTLDQIVCEPEQSLDGVGHLVQVVPLCKSFPNAGSQFDYSQLLAGLSAETSWFAEWRVVTDGPSEELGFTAPSAFLVWDGDFDGYHFTISDDRFRLIANEFSSLHDLEPGIPHTFRVELFGENLGEAYGIYVDGEVIFSGVPVGPLWNPPWPPEVKFRAKSKLEPSTTTWDYIRWGPIGSEGDFTADGAVDSADLPFFEECLTTESGNWVGCAWADFTDDGGVDCSDAAQFVAAWTGAGDPPVFAACAVLCQQDLDDNGSVNAADLAVLLGAWGPNPGHLADLNSDDVVNASDLAMLLGAWGPC